MSKETMSKADTKAAALLIAHLSRGGRFGYWWVKRGESKESIWWPVGAPAPIPQAERADVYFGVHPCQEKRADSQRSTIATIAAINCLFAEFDAKHFGDDKAAALAHVEALRPPASWINDSGGGYHAYWLLAETFALDSDEARRRAREIQTAWVKYTRGDDAAKDLARVLRVPGTRNYKPERAPAFPIVSVVRAELERLYTLDALASIAAPPAAPVAARANGQGKPAGLNGASSSAAERKYVEKAVSGEVARVTGAANGERNATLNRAAFSLGQLVAGGVLSRGEAERELAQAARAVGLAEGETLATIKSGLDAGALEPRRPDPRPRSLNGRGEHAETPAPTLDELAGKVREITGSSDERRAQALEVADLAGRAGLSAKEWLKLRDELTTHGARPRELGTIYKAAGQSDAPRVTRLDVAESLVSQWAGLTLFDMTAGAWRRWDGCAWALLEKDDLAAEVVEHAQACGMLRGEVTGRMIDDVTMLARLRPGARSEAWDVTPGVYFQNGRLDPLTLTLYKHDPADYNRVVLPMDWHKGADCPKWSAHLERAVPDKGARLALAEHLALALTGDTGFHTALVLVGPPRSGKSVTMEVMRACLGEFAAETSAVIFAEGDAESGRRAVGLVDCRLATIDELPGEALKADSLFKRMAAHGLIEARGIYRDALNFRWRAKFIFSANEAPRIYDRSGAVAARLCFVDFPNSLLGQTSAINRRLAQEIIGDELAGVVRWALRAYKPLVERKTYTETEAMRASAETIVKEADPIQAFKDERLVIGPKYKTGAAELYTAWREWALSNGFQPGSRNTLRQALTLTLRLAPPRHTESGAVWEGVAVKK